MTFMLSFGKWGGFYWYRGFGRRLCLGWLVLTWLPADIDDCLAGVGIELNRLRAIEAAIRECPTTGMSSCKVLVYTTELRDALEAK